jgi:hypothetical protein
MQSTFLLRDAEQIRSFGNRHLPKEQPEIA